MRREAGVQPAPVETVEDRRAQPAKPKPPAVAVPAPSPAPSAPAPTAREPDWRPPTYTVKRGDTLYKIAAQRYGEGKQWQRIVSANPGLDPAKLRVGQTITLP